MQQMAEAVMEREAYAEEVRSPITTLFSVGEVAQRLWPGWWLGALQARQAGAVSRLTKVLATTGEAVTAPSKLCFSCAPLLCLTLLAMHADDEVLLDAAADVISACCGLLACGGKVHNLAVYCLHDRLCTLADRQSTVKQPQTHCQSELCMLSACCHHWHGNHLYMHIAEDMVLKQALVKFCTHLELASAFMHKVVRNGSLSCSNCHVVVSVAAAYSHAFSLHARLFMIFYAKFITLTGSPMTGVPA